MKPSSSSRTLRFLTDAVLALALVAFGYVFLQSMRGTSMLDPADYWGEHILFLTDSVPQNLLVLCLSFLPFLLLFCIPGRVLNRLSLPLLSGVVLLFMLLFGAVYIKQVDPEVSADARMIMRASQDFLNGDYAAISTTTSYFGRYFHDYPFQLGLCLFYQCVQGVVGAGHLSTMAMLNTCALVFSYACLLYMTHAFFADRRVTLLTLLFLALFFQPLLYCTLLYGGVLAFSLACAAMALFTAFVKTERAVLLFPMAVCCGLAVTMKLNAMVIVIALSILLVLYAFMKRRWIAALFAALSVALALAFPSGVTSFYEHRANAALTPGATAYNWLSCGLTESDRAPGWYAPMPYSFAPEDREATDARMKSDIKARLALFRSHPAYARDFFHKKLMSQWDEPTFQCVWVSRIKKLEKRMPPLVDAIYSSSVDGGLFQYFKYQVQFFYAACVLGLSALLFSREARRKGDAFRLLFSLFPLAAFGGFLYHALAEAKSQYVLTYVILLLPLAAYGVKFLAAGVFRRFPRSPHTSEKTADAS